MWGGGGLGSLFFSSGMLFAVYARMEMRRGGGNSNVSLKQVLVRRTVVAPGGSDFELV